MNNESYESIRDHRKMSGTTIFLIFATVVLLGACIYLFANASKQARNNTYLTTELSSSETRYADLDARYAAALTEIETHKGKSAELDSILVERESTIKNLRANLSKEKKQRGLSEAEYQRQISEINVIVGDLTAKVETLQRENTTLAGQRDSLGRDVETKQATISEMEVVNTALSKKVTVASLLIPSDITVSGTRAKSSGKEAETSKASKSEELKVCFNVPENKVADAGEKVFLVRILSPEGAVLSIQDLGSGTFTAVETGEQSQYTTTAVVDYKQQAAEACARWRQTNPFAPGSYSAEIYQDGYLIGKKVFELK